MDTPGTLDLGRDFNVIKLAREVAIDHFPVADILARYGIDEPTWEALNEWPRFRELVDHERQQWNSALNTNARIRLKSATLIEEWMEEGHILLHDKQQSFSSKIELVKLLGKFSGLEATEKVIGETAAGRVTINIKIGEDQLAYDDESPMIEAQVTESNPDEISFDWDEEFAASPSADADKFFEAAE